MSCSASLALQGVFACNQCARPPATKRFQMVGGKSGKADRRINGRADAEKPRVESRFSVGSLKVLREAAA